MKDEYARKLETLMKSVFEGPGRLPAETRRALAERKFVPAALEKFRDKVFDRAVEISDEDVDALRAAGMTEDEIYEAAVASALGAARVRLDAALSAIACMSAPVSTALPAAKTSEKGGSA